MLGCRAIEIWTGDARPFSQARSMHANVDVDVSVRILASDGVYKEGA